MSVSAGETEACAVSIGQRTALSKALIDWCFAKFDMKPHKALVLCAIYSSPIHVVMSSAVTPVAINNCWNEVKIMIAAQIVPQDPYDSMKELAAMLVEFSTSHLCL